MTISANRRSFLKGAATLSAALVIGLDTRGQWAAAAETGFMPNPFVRIAPDGTVTVILKHFEMGQGTTTGLATLVAEELDADWATVVTEFAPADTSKYVNKALGVQGTGGSTAIANSFQQYREAGAAAKSLLVQAAAKEWNVPPDEIVVSGGSLSHGTNTARFGDLVGKVPADATPDVKLKTPDQFSLIGKDRLPRKDTPAKINGTAQFAMDTVPEGTVYAVVLHAPKFGGTVKSVDDAEARKVRGVVDVRQVPTGVAVYAEHTWAAMQGRDALKVDWDFSKAETRSSDAMEAEYARSLDEDGLVARNDGDVTSALASADKTIEAEFHFPFLAHAPMEPQNCVVQIKDGKTTLWDGNQFQTVTQAVVGAISGVGAENTAIHTLYAGGSFGRRANANADYQAEATMVAKALGSDRPAKLVWTREDDIRGGYYRPMTRHRIRAGVDKDGKVVAWHSSLANKSIFTGTPMEKVAVHDGVDHFSVEGAVDTAYAIPNLRVDVRNMQTEVPVLWWRSVGHSHSGYAMEVAMDMLAEAAGRDPVELREELLAGDPRRLGVLRMAADKARWGSTLPEGWGRGIAVHKSFDTYVAEVAEVSVKDGKVKLERVVAAVDVGIAVNPDVIRAQVEGAIGYGLGHVMRDKITFTDGMVDQSNFPDYMPLRMSDMPKIEVHIVESTEAPTGIGEPGLPPAGPAVANAIFAATGKRVMHLPMIDDGIDFA